LSHSNTVEHKKKKSLKKKLSPLYHIFNKISNIKSTSWLRNFIFNRDAWSMFADNFSIKDSKGKDAYKVKGDVFKVRIVRYLYIQMKLHNESLPYPTACTIM
jgi:hypothetical protein